MENNKKLITGEEALATFISEITVNGEDVPVSGGSAAITVNTLPSVTAADNGKALIVSNGAWQAIPVINVYSGGSAPSQAVGNDGDIYLQT